MEVVGQAAAVAQLVGNVGGLIFKIKREADTAKQNKRECENLVDYLSTIEEVLPTLPEDPEVARPLAKLGSTLQEAHDLVVACQKRGSFSKLFRASCLADRFREVNARITCDLSLFPLVIYTAIARRLDRMAQNDDSGTMAPAGAGSSKGKSSGGTVGIETQTQMVVSHVSCSGSDDDDNPRKLTWPEIAASTSNLAVVLGGGRSGTVYKGSLHHGGRVREVAVKVLKKHGRQGMEVSFVAELEILFPLRHDHIARLVGWCEEAEEERRVFVYDHMSNGTLRDHLLGSGGSPVAASWSGRVEVLLGAARALEHLHHRRATTLPAVIHRNVSSCNILLDARWRPHLSDFGQALLQAACEEPGGQLVPEAIGTFGYLDPEYYSTRRVSPAIDVYSFGVVTLEVLTGRPHVLVSSKQAGEEVPVAMVSSVLPVIQSGKLRDVLDARPSLVPTPGQLKALELVANTAMLCLWPQGKDRPDISKVVANLDKALGIIRSDDETNLLLSY
uniref:Uncharacterized protein n=1 Tax=Avena sativa TaxID=4498 RepID=A0ACD5VEX5_AVESA